MACWTKQKVVVGHGSFVCVPCLVEVGGAAAFLP